MSKRKPSKFRRRKREQRARAKPITVDIETRGPISGHFHMSDTHAFDHQLMAYARLAGLDEVVIITGGDLIHPKASAADLVPYEIGDAARKAMADYQETIRRAMASKQPYIPDPRLDPFTGRVMPVFGEDE